MDATNRALIIAGALVWIFLVMVVVLLTWAEPDQSIEWIQDLAGYMDDHNETSSQLIITFGGLILILLGLALMIYEVTPSSAGTLNVKLPGGGTARIDTEEVARRVTEELRIMPQLREVHVEVTSRSAKAQVALELQVGEEADLSSTTEEACARTRQLLEERMGVTLNGPPKAKLYYRTLRVSKQAETAPQGGDAGATAPPPASPLPVSPEPAQTLFTRPQPPAPEGTASASPDAGATGGVQPSHDASETPPEDRPAGA